MVSGHGGEDDGALAADLRDGDRPACSQQQADTPQAAEPHTSTLSTANGIGPGRMEVMNELEKLRAPDPRTLAFVPGGLGIDVQMKPEGAAEYWQQVVSRFVLHDDVGEETRRSFADLKTVLPYGVLCYEAFTLVHDRALFVFEQALRDRFIDYCREHHGGTVILKFGETNQEVTASRYDEVIEAVRGASPKARPRLVVTKPDGQTETITFDAGLDALHRWTRLAGLLEGQRNKVVEDVIRRMRNDVAHPDGYHLLMPVDAARNLSDLAEIINHLWGHDTPGGTLYPAPVTRHAVVFAWDSATGDRASSLAGNLAEEAGWEPFTDFAFVQGEWPSTGDLDTYDSWFETTATPVDYLWGPGSRADALTWLEGHPPTTDTVSILGRRFMIRVDAEHVWRPMRPEVAAALPANRRDGHWYLVGADTPDLAFTHTRGLLDGGAKCGLASTCPACGARNFDHGDWLAVLKRARITRGGVALPPDFCLPGPWGGIRFAARPTASASPPRSLR